MVRGLLVRVAVGMVVSLVAGGSFI
jgi:hypothetical protein